MEGVGGRPRFGTDRGTVPQEWHGNTLEGDRMERIQT